MPLRAFSTLTTQEAQVIPDTGKAMVADFLSFLASWAIYLSLGSVLAVNLFNAPTHNLELLFQFILCIF
jgi:hypothetical protein